MQGRVIGNAAAMFALLVGSLAPNWPFSGALRFVALAYIVIDLGLKVRAGYLRRRPHWTPESWRRYLMICLFPLGALVVWASFTTALELRLPLAGDPQSTLRSMWITATVISLLGGAIGLGIVVDRLVRGEAERQFTWTPWWKRPS